MKYIEVKFWGTKDVSRIILEEDKIKVESENEEDRLFFADLIAHPSRRDILIEFNLKKKKY